jgi:hypothetical protein
MQMIILIAWSSPFAHVRLASRNFAGTDDKQPAHPRHQVKPVSDQVDNKIDLISVERHRANLQELVQISEMFMLSHMAKAHFSADHHYLGCQPNSCKVCQLRNLLIHLREEALAQLEAALLADSAKIGAKPPLG